MTINTLMSSSRRFISTMIHGLIGAAPSIEQTAIANPVAFSRADAADYARLVKLWTARADKGLGGLPKRDCPACGSAHHHPVLTSYDGYPFHECEDCGTWFVPLVITEAVIDRFFEDVPEARELSDRMMIGREERTREGDRARFMAYFDLVAPLMKSAERRRYLDIGCGVGHSIELATELGYEALGLEVNGSAIETARARGRNVVHPAEWPGGTESDLVSLFETLEHVTQPEEMVATCRKALAPGGLLLITVPNGAGSEVRLLRERCLHVFGGSENVGHINLFTPRGLEQLLKRHGLAPLLLDGQFSNNIQLIVATLMASAGGRGPAFPEIDRNWQLPTALVQLLGALGPDWAALERATLRAPILICLAARAEDAPNFAPAINALRANVAQNIASSLAAVGPLSAAPAGRSISMQILTGQRDDTGLVLRRASAMGEYLFEGKRVKLPPGQYVLRARGFLDKGRLTVGLLTQDEKAWLGTTMLETGESRGEVRIRLIEPTRTRLVVSAANLTAGPVHGWISDIELVELSASEAVKMGQ